MSTSWQTKLVEEINDLKGQRRVLNDRVKELETKGMEIFCELVDEICRYMDSLNDIATAKHASADYLREKAVWALHMRMDVDNIKANLEAK